MTDKNYFELPLMSYSILSTFDKKGPQSINAPFKGGDEEYYILGHAVEEIIQGTEQSFNEKFIVTDNVKPTAMLGTLADAMVESNIPYTLDNAVTTARMLGLWKSTVKKEVYESKIDIEQFWEYLKLQDVKKGKMLISSETYKLAGIMADTVSNHEFTKYLINPEEGVEVLTQVVVLWGNGKCKSKLDFVRVDHNAKTITPIDLKTGAVYKDEFIRQFFKLRYDIQAAMYYDAMREWAFANYPDYELLQFQFVYISRLEPNTPMTFTISNGTRHEGKNGKVIEDRVIRRGYVELMEDYEWHLKNEVFNYSRTAYESNGNIII